MLIIFTKTFVNHIKIYQKIFFLKKKLKKITNLENIHTFFFLLLNFYNVTSIKLFIQESLNFEKKKSLIITFSFVSNI